MENTGPIADDAAAAVATAHVVYERANEDEKGTPYGLVDTRVR